MAGHRLLNDDASWAEVVSVEVVDAPLLAYNLTVEGFHTYFVAANKNAAPVWVHNNCFKFVIGNGQFGIKANSHMADYGLNVTNAADRARFKEIIESIATNHNISVVGDFAGQAVTGSSRGPVQFLIQGADVVVTKPNGVFVTILKNGVTNPSVIATLNKAGITP